MKSIWVRVTLILALTVIIAGSAFAAPPELRPTAAQRAEDAYAFVADLRQKASAYNPANAKHRYLLNCHDPAASAAGEFLNAWSDAVLVATEGQVYIEVGVSNAFSTGGTMAALDEMISGSIDFVFTLPSYYRGYMPLTLAFHNPALGSRNVTVASAAVWDLYKYNADVQAEYKKSGHTLFVWANNPSPLSYKGNAEISNILEIRGNVRGNAGPIQMFITEIGASIFSCPIGEVYTNVSTGVIDFLITDWHGIASFRLNDPGVLNYYLDTNLGSSVYCLMVNDDTWAEITSNGFAQAVESVSGDYMLNLVGIWESYEVSARETAVANGGVIYPPNSTLAFQLQNAFDAVAEKWVAETGGVAKQVYDQAVELAKKYNDIYH